MTRPEPVLHVTNGDSVIGTLRATSLGGEALSWLDVLCEGPVPAQAPADFRETRAAFLAAHDWGEAGEIVLALERRDRLFTEALTRGRHVVLWFEHDLFDQLQLLQILALAGEVGFEQARLELINVGTFEGKPAFAGLGELAPPELESLWPLRRPVLAEQTKLATAGWAAVRASEPTALERFLETDTSALPFLAGALHRLLEQLPDAVTGLSRSERQLLGLLADGPRTPPQLFDESQRLEEAPYEGDTWVRERLAGLGAGAQALVAPAEDGEMLAITETGRDVLGGRLDGVEILGIDRWVGGTHLRPGHVPRWDRARNTVTLAR